MRTIRSLLAVAALAASGTAARADFLYSWSNPTGPNYASGTGSVSVITAGSGVGSPSIPVASFFATSSASSGSPDLYNKSYTLDLHLTDTASGTSGDLHFLAAITGSASFDSYHLQNTFADPSQQITLGGSTYSVTLTPTVFGIVGPRAASDNFDTHASVTVQPATNSPPPTSNTPEPGTMILAGIAAVAFGGGRLRRKKRVHGESVQGRRVSIEQE